MWPLWNGGTDRGIKRKPLLGKQRRRCASRVSKPSDD
ncbi:hypothetical protein A2U01_0109693, partial [Trifolium medium]|nr:hypothetical protein [Trifolium medium]